MPTYDYRCEACGHEFEEMQSFKADPLKTCPKCGQDAPAPTVWHRRCSALQGERFLRDRLPERVLQEGGKGRVDAGKAGRF